MTPEWQRDGWDVKWRIGILAPHADLGPESEFNAMAPADVGIYAARVPFGAMGVGGKMDPTIPLAPVRAFAEPPHVDDAVERLSAAPVHSIGFGFTSSAYVIGAAQEHAMIERLTDRAGGIPVVATGAAAVEALGAVGAKKIALIDAPWFDQELNDLGRRYYESAGFEVVFAAPCGVPSDQELITPVGVFDFAVANVPSTADAVVTGGNGFRAVGVIDALESKLGIPVLTANSVLFWSALRAAGAPASVVTNYGRLFAL